MSPWHVGLALLLLVNVALFFSQLLGVGSQLAHMEEPGLRADWVGIERPWAAPPPAGVAASAADAPAPKIDLKAGQAQLQDAIENASNGVFNNRPLGLECRMWGPFLPSDYVRTEEALRAWAGQVARLERQVAVGYVVYLPKPVVDSGQGMGQLAGKGIADAFYMNTPGPMQGTISLGLFRDRLRAVQHRAELQAKGIDGVEIRERLGPTRVFFELRGSPGQLGDLQQIYNLNPKAELQPCASDGAN
ncbi:MAG TPA: hypothetical protein VFV39_10720 [Limnobacter sp.]|nr:hypothetical protein [Limnobacter sp.]